MIWLDNNCKFYVVMDTSGSVDALSKWGGSSFGMTGYYHTLMHGGVCLDDLEIVNTRHGRRLFYYDFESEVLWSLYGYSMTSMLDVYGFGVTIRGRVHGEVMVEETLSPKVWMHLGALWESSKAVVHTG